MDFFPNLSQTGDTIIEVLLSMSILALVLTATFVSTNHSLQNGTDSSNRQQALALAQQQVELIKSALPQQGGNFCIDNAGTVQTTSANCQLGIANQYNLTDTYNPATGLYTVLAQWPAVNSAGSQLTVYYKVGR